MEKREAISAGAILALVIAFDTLIHPRQKTEQPHSLAVVVAEVRSVVDAILAPEDQQF